MGCRSLARFNSGYVGKSKPGCFEKWLKSSYSKLPAVVMKNRKYTTSLRQIRQIKHFITFRGIEPIEVVTIIAKLFFCSVQRLLAQKCVDLLQEANPEITDVLVIVKKKKTYVDLGKHISKLGWNYCDHTVRFSLHRLTRSAQNTQLTLSQHILYEVVNEKYSQVRDGNKISPLRSDMMWLNLTNPWNSAHSYIHTLLNLM